MPEKIVILGAGGFGREASLLIEDINENSRDFKRWQLLGYIDEDEAKWGKELRGYPVLGGSDALSKLPLDVKVICVIGEPKIKKTAVEITEKLSRVFVTLIHPEVILSNDVKIGKGVLINKGVIMTTNIRIGDHVSINPGCGIGHDAMVGAYSTLMWQVNISGSAKISDGCLIGTGATVLQDNVVGEWSTVGAGAVVTKDLPPKCTAVGIPAYILKYQEELI